MPINWGKLQFALTKGLSEFPEDIPDLHQHLLAVIQTYYQNRKLALFCPCSFIKYWNKHFSWSPGWNNFNHQWNSLSSSVRNLLKNFGCYFVICMSFPWKGCFDDQITVSWKPSVLGLWELCVFPCDVKYHMGMRSHLHSWLSLTKIPWVILLLLPIKSSKEARVVFTFVNWFHPAFLLIMIPLLESECSRVFLHSRWRRIGVLYKKVYV